VVETDWLPTRIELAGPDRAWVDLHPLQFDADSCGRLVLLDGAKLMFRPDAFTTGTLHGRTSSCLSAVQQRTVHAGYDPRPEDFHDLAQLASLTPGEAPRTSESDDESP
jgi:lincosamide nucleotidyltransferase A/C/D/E